MTTKLINPSAMSYVDLLSYIEEVNRCPGGKRTINNIVSKSLLSDDAQVLEIGSNTGFTSIEIAKLKNCKVIGIDVNPQAVEKSMYLLSKEPKSIQDRVSFRVGDAANLNFDDNQFDLVVTGGANTFIPENDREKALSEYRRVLKPYGMLSVTNLFYHDTVPKEVLTNLRNVLGFEVKPWTKYYWLDLLLKSGLELYSYDETEMQARSSEVLNQFTSKLIDDSPALANFDDEVKSNFKDRWFEIMNVFNENHRYLSFMTVLLRNQYVTEQQELFLEKDTIDPWNLKGQFLWEVDK
ncbi:class I SAM-dependent methyltransferase (plasmid) [Peribacillus psychrosaccharolyticus]|uniref:Class I SAM-dependent methyltransferase n=2 Tax=Peribacillus psychrosaccharolyticus TaxID=1407 RepID=A0A974NIY1_PERPY|nr:class I SAM-dependent methyltransferase [Peribacillus psychrosaccharolyticus]MEC2054227.1 class I SAM-dependent methyltransferase [Peribacillus psychrosaccharolyticus]QQS98417.1 class I SAM-dependent methyltransferase [Peribacillus psychrosaccharolyticus]